MSNDGMNYAPQGKPQPVVKPGEFVFAATALDHGHINGQCNGLVEAGGTLKWVWDREPQRLEAFCKRYPGVRLARCLDEILQDEEVRLVAAAAIPNERGPLGCQVMRHGKDYFTDKCPFTTLDQVEEARRTAAQTKRKYMVYYSERLHVEAAIFAGQLVHDEGAIGRVVQVMGLGPHRLGTGRPDWFFRKAQYGGILCDIGSHQIEQFLFFASVRDATISAAHVGNFRNPQTPELEDYGDATLVGDNGSTQFFRVDWLNPDGLRTWGDGRLFILGTEGYIELRKYIDVAAPERVQDVCILVNKQGEKRFDCNGKVGFPFFGRLIRDCLERTESAMTQAHAFKAGELCVKAQLAARRIHG